MVSWFYSWKYKNSKSIVDFQKQKRIPRTMLKQLKIKKTFAFGCWIFMKKYSFTSSDGKVLNNQPWTLSRIFAIFYGIFAAIVML